MEHFTSTNKEIHMSFDPLQMTSQQVYFDDFLGFLTESSQNANIYTPRSRTRSNTKRNENSFSLEVEMPGLSRSDININIENNLLTVAGTRETDNRKVYYTRSWQLGENVIQESITARYDAGLLYVEVPLSAPRKRNISVE